MTSEVSRIAAHRAFHPDINHFPYIDFTYKQVYLIEYEQLERFGANV